MRIVIACRRCGYERLVTRDDLIGGTWRNQKCPACEVTQTNTTEDEREPVPAA